MWPFRRRKKDLPPPPPPELWGPSSALAVRISDFVYQHNDAFWEAVNQGNGELEVVFDKVGSVRVQATLLPDGTPHYAWGKWVPYDQYKGKRPYEAPTHDPGGSTVLVISTSIAEQVGRGFIFTLDDVGNGVFVRPTDRFPTEYLPAEYPTEYLLKQRWLG